MNQLVKAFLILAILRYLRKLRQKQLDAEAMRMEVMMGRKRRRIEEVMKPSARMMIISYLRAVSCRVVSCSVKN